MSNLVHIADKRLNITDDVEIAVKSGVDSSKIQRDNFTSNSSSSTSFSLSIPTEGTILDRNIKVQGRLAGYFHVPANTSTAYSQLINVVPSAFPLNSCLMSATATLNSSSLTIQTQDVMNVLTKQNSQEFLSENCGSTPNCVDKYFGLISDALEADGVNAVKGSNFYDLSSLTIGRSNYDFSVSVYDASGASVASAGYSAGTEYYVQFFINIYEPILGLPALSIQDDEGGIIGVRDLKLVLQYNDCRNMVGGDAIFNDAGVSFSSGAKFTTTAHTATTAPLSSDTQMITTLLSPDISNFARYSGKCVIPYTQLTPYKREQTHTTGSVSLNSNTISLKQIPDKIYVQLRPTYNSQQAGWSNQLAMAISKVNVSFNNQDGLLSEMDATDLFHMSKRNGSRVPYSDFMGHGRNQNGSTIVGVGSLVVIDPVRDLRLREYLTNGSVGQFSLQLQVDGSFYDSSFSAGTVELSIVCANSAVAITEHGMTYITEGLLTKEMVMSGKSQPVDDYHHSHRILAGGNFMMENIIRPLSKLAVHSPLGRMAQNPSARREVVSEAKKVAKKVSGKKGGAYTLTAGSSSLSKFL